MAERLSRSPSVPRLQGTRFGGRRIVALRTAGLLVQRPMHVGDGGDEAQVRQEAVDIGAEPESGLLQRVRAIAVGDGFEELVERRGLRPHDPIP